MISPLRYVVRKIHLSCICTVERGSRDRLRGTRPPVPNDVGGQIVRRRGPTEHVVDLRQHIDSPDALVETTGERPIAVPIPEHRVEMMHR